MTRDAQELWERLAFTALVGVVSGAAAIVAARLAEWGWTRLRNAPPPEPIGLLKSLAQKAGESGVHRFGL